MGINSANESQANDSGYISSPNMFQNDNNLFKTYNEIKSFGWYWGDITREFAEELLSGKPDGAFLVRNSLNSKNICEFTLTLRKDGSTKLIKILHDIENNKYGFAKPLTFSSVKSLVDFYQHNSLVEYNRTLNIKLGIPISRFTYEKYDTDALSYSHSPEEPRPLSLSPPHKERSPNSTNSESNMTDQSFKMILSHVVKAYKYKSRAFDQAYGEFTDLRTRLNRDRRAHKCVRALESSFVNQLDLLIRNTDKYKEELARNVNDTKIISENCTFLQVKLKKIIEAKKKLESEINDETRHCDALEKGFNSIKPELLTLHKRKEHIKRQLMSRGFKQHTIENWVAEAEEESLDNSSQKGSKFLPRITEYHSNRKTKNYRDKSPQLSLNGIDVEYPNYDFHHIPMSSNTDNIVTALDLDKSPLQSNINEIFNFSHMPSHSPTQASSVGTLKLNKNTLPSPQLKAQNIPKPIFRANMDLSGSGLRDEPLPMSLIDLNIASAPRKNQSIHVQQYMSPDSSDDASKVINVPPTNETKQWDTVSDQNLWLLLNCDRERAENLLLHKPEGTFLIRSSSKSAYALSIKTTNGRTKHCLIYKNPEVTDASGGFGFVEPYPFSTIYDLVDFYRINSLEDHNPELTTTLKFPALNH